MKHRFYIAAPLGEYLAANGIAEQLARLGHDIVSSWHHVLVYAPIGDPAGVPEKAVIWQINKRELREADHLVIYTASGNPRATYCELGYFLGLAEQSHDMGCVYWIAPDAEKCPVPVGDDLVVHCESVAELLEAMNESSR